jgi:hemolysin D
MNDRAMNQADPQSAAPGRVAAEHPLLALWRRYAGIWRAAWAMRRELAGPTLQTEEAAFLPAALSLQATPVHPAPRRAALLICLLFAVALAWAAIGQIDVVATAAGRIVVSDGSKTIQPLQASVVSAIHVKDGDHVQSGQALVDLDAGDSSADRQRAASDRSAAVSEALRTRALLAALQSGREPALGPVPGSADWTNRDRLDAQAQLNTEWTDIQAKLAKLEAARAHRQAEIATMDNQVGKLEATLPMARRREADFKSLSDQGYVGSHESQDRTRERVEMEKDLVTTQTRKVEAEAALREAESELASYLSETSRTLRERQTQAELKQAETTQDVVKSTQHVQLAHLASPVAGTVQQLAVHTPGGVVTPAQVLMIIVPDAARVTAEATLDNKDIGFVHIGQRSEIKLEPFPYTRYGTIAAMVSTISSDAVLDDKKPDPASGRPTATFPVRLTLLRGDIDIDGRRVKLTPGMNVTAEIKTGRRRIIDYLLSPVREVIAESAGER